MSHSKSRSRSKSAKREWYSSQYQINSEQCTLSTINSRQSPKHDRLHNLDVWLSPNWSSTGTSRKGATNDDEHQNGKPQRRSCLQEWYQSPDGTYSKQSGKNTIKWDLWCNTNPLSYGQLRNSATSHYAQLSGELNRGSCTSHWYSPPVGTPDRHSTKSAIDHDDNVQISLDVSQCWTSDASHDTCTTQDVTCESGFRKLEKNMMHHKV